MTDPVTPLATTPVTAPATPIEAPQQALTPVAASLYPDSLEAKPEPVITAPAVEPEAVTPSPEVEASKPVAEATPAPTVDYATLEFKLPEGAVLDDKSLTAFRDLAKETALPPEAAQKLLDQHFALLAEANAKAQEIFNATQAAWQTQIDAMPEFAPGVRDQTISLLGKFMDEFGSPELAQALNSTGLGNNPHMVKMVLDVAKTLTEGSPTPQGAPPSQKAGRTLGARLYPETSITRN